MKIKGLIVMLGCITIWVVDFMVLIIMIPLSYIITLIDIIFRKKNLKEAITKRFNGWVFAIKVEIQECKSALKDAQKELGL